MEINEKYRGQKDGIILFILSKGERHADELKIIIDEYFSGVKIGTLYSIIARLKTQNFISEYRASSIDGSRRKYYKLTDKGLKAYNENYAQLFIDVNVELTKKDYSTIDEQASETQVINVAEFNEENPAIEVKEEIIVENEPTAEEINNSTIYLEMINDTILDTDFSNDIDFSSVEQVETVKEIKEEDNKQEIKKVESEFISYNYTETDLPMVNEQKEINQDSVLNSKYEYTSLLNKMFPKKAKEEAIETQEVVETNDISENVVVKEFSESNANWNEVYALAEKEGIKIRTSSDTNRYQGSKILLSRLMLCSTLITTFLVVLQYLLLTAIIPNVAFSGQTLLILASLYGSLFVIALINFFINPFLQVKNLPRFINVIEIALIITISTAIIAFSIAVIKEINFSDSEQIFASIVLPIVTAFNLIVFAIITYLLSKSEHFESI